MDKQRQSLEDRAAALQQKMAALPPTRAVFVDVVSGSNRAKSKELLTEQLFREDQVQQDYAQLQRVNDALRRLDNGDYGMCQQCGDSISASRLQLLPETPLCLTCQQTVEAG